MSMLQSRIRMHGKDILWVRDVEREREGAFGDVEGLAEVDQPMDRH